MRTLYHILLCGGLAAAVHGENLHHERVWRSAGGKVLLATFVRTTHNASRVELFTRDGKLVSIDIMNLSEADRLLVTNPRAEVGGSPDPAAAFKPLPVPDRGSLPVISQEDFGSKASDCVPSSFCNFLLWWDQQGILNIPKRGDFHDKADWVHTRVARYCVTRNNRGTYAGDAVEGFREYFERELGDVATMKVRIDHDITPANLARYTVGWNATMLGMTIRHGPRHDSGHWVALASAAADGTIVFHTWGARFEGRMEAIVAKPGKGPAPDPAASRTSYRIRIINTADLPEWFRSSEMEMIIDPAQWDCICVVKPFVYAVEGKRAPAPPDPLLDPPAAP